MSNKSELQRVVRVGGLGACHSGAKARTVHSHSCGKHARRAWEGNDIPMCCVSPHKHAKRTYGMCVRFNVRVEIARDIHSGESAPPSKFHRPPPGDVAQVGTPRELWVAGLTTEQWYAYTGLE